MIDFNAMDFSERRFEEVISFFWRSVYITRFLAWTWYMYFFISVLFIYSLQWNVYTWYLYEEIYWGGVEMNYRWKCPFCITVDKFQL